MWIVAIINGEKEYSLINLDMFYKISRDPNHKDLTQLFLDASRIITIEMPIATLQKITEARREGELRQPVASRK